MRDRLPIRLNPTDLVLIAYLSLTGLFILFQFNKFDAPMPGLWSRILAVCIIFILAATVKNSVRLRNLSEIVRLMYPLTFLPFLYNETDNLNNFIFRHDLDPVLSAWEESLFHSQPALEFARIFHSDVFAELMYFGYISYYLMLAGLPLILYFKGKSAEAQKIVFQLVLSFTLFYIIFIILPVAGPQYYFTGLNPLPDGFVLGPLLRIIQATGEAPTAAFPSSHVAICLMILYFSFQKLKKLRVILILVSLLLLFSTVYIRAHYVLDVIAGILIAPLFYQLTNKCFTFLLKSTEVNAHEY